MWRILVTHKNNIGIAINPHKIMWFIITIIQSKIDIRY